ncbi:MAG: RHS repeat-associated core domain-containing protein, partial [Acidobacteriota bacterium]
FDLATNRVNAPGYAHDANGNMTAMPGYNNLTYDIDNRLLSANGNGSWEQYAYLADNKRVWKQTNQNGNPVEQYYLYGVGGERIATYIATISEGALLLTNPSREVYFGGRLIWQNGKAVLRDRLGSVMARAGDYTALERHDYFPYGEERTPSIGDRNKFGTYHRDQTGLDYADQRYYNSAIGRFLSADPYEASGGATEPTSWGRGVYVHGDPVNFLDPSGLFRCIASHCLEPPPPLPQPPPPPPGGGGGGGGAGCGMTGCLEVPPDFERPNPATIPPPPVLCDVEVHLDSVQSGILGTRRLETFSRKHQAAFLNFTAAAAHAGVNLAGFRYE